MTAARLRVGALLGVAVLLVVIAVGAPSDEATGALEPDGKGRNGAKALVLVLEQLGADVDAVRGAPSADASTAVVLRDRLTDADAAATLRWVRGGGVVLLADAGGALGRLPAVVDAAPAPCPAALDVVGRLDLGGGDVVERADRFGDRCFDGAVRVADLGAGSVVELASPAPFTNTLLGEEDNAVLAAAVLAPRAGVRVAFVVGPSPRSAAAGDETLTDLVDRRVREGLAVGAIALLVWVAWRARRLGRPVLEDQPVSVAGSELVVAVGRLLDARRRPDEAAAVLRAGTRRAVLPRLGLGADADAGVAAAAVSSRTGLDVDRVAAALGARTVTTDDDLLAVAADLDRIRTDVLGSRTS